MFTMQVTKLGNRNATKEDFGHVLEAIKSGSIDVDRYITHRASFADMIEQFDSWLKPELKVIKAMVEL